MLVFTSKDLIQSVSRYNDEYHCTIVKVEFVSGAIRVHIDERGDMSLGIIQPPSFSSLGIYDNGYLREAVRSKDSNFTVSNPESQYTGYLDFDVSICHIPDGSIIGFQYGASGYSTAQLFRFDPSMAPTMKRN